MSGPDAVSETEEDALKPKADPAGFVLRGRIPRAIRFKRGVIVALAAATSLGVIATAWIALKPHALHLVQGPDAGALSQDDGREAISTLPASYANVPRLGPPLPGDLGRPILDHQNDRALPADRGRPDTSSATERRRDQRRVLSEAALASGLMVSPSARDLAPERGGSAEPVATPAPSPPARLGIDAERDPNAQQRKADFMRRAETSSPVDPHRLAPLASPYTLSAGSVISASLITGLRSDLPGIVIAQVTERVFDSASGRIALIPQGARLIGSYDSVVAFGQRRALVVWQRIILPDGSSLQIDNVPATDPAGYSGLEDKVDFHTWQLLKGVVLSTLLGVGASLQFSGDSDLIEAIRQSTQQNVSRAGDQLTSRNLQIQPTITIQPGSPVRLIVHRDLVLAPWKDEK